MTVTDYLMINLNMYYFNLFLNVIKIDLELIYYTTKKYKQLKLCYVKFFELLHENFA